MFERTREILDYPRAVGLDDEAMRTFQAAGLAEPLLADMIQNIPMRMYAANKQCVAEILPTTREFGWYRRNLFSQPLAERTLRAGLQRFSQVRLELGAELVGLSQDVAGVTATVKAGDGSERALRAQYLIAADGGRSTVRETLLKLPFSGKTHPRKWVVIECENDPLDAPYTALHCEPERPFVCLRLPYGLRRWEFMLFPGEDAERMLEPAKMHELLRPHVASPESLQIVRARVYTHSSRVCTAFVSGRICLAGDAAHLMPPWIGQGLNAGLRDASNLAWKVAWIVRGRLNPEALASYHDERHAHVKAMADLADTFGALLSLTNKPLAAARDGLFRAIRHAPRFRDYVLQMKFKPMPRYQAGFVVDNCSRAQRDQVGRMFIQPWVENAERRTVRLDEALGPGFALLAWRVDIGRRLPAGFAVRLRRLECRIVESQRSRSGLAPRSKVSPSPGAIGAEDTESALEAWFRTADADWVLIRPDRYVAAIGRTADLAARIGYFLDTFATGHDGAETADFAAATELVAPIGRSAADSFVNASTTCPRHSHRCALSDLRPVDRLPRAPALIGCA